MAERMLGRQAGIMYLSSFLRGRKGRGTALPFPGNPSPKTTATPEKSLVVYTEDWTDPSRTYFRVRSAPKQYAYRRDRSALDAVQHVHKADLTGHGENRRRNLSSYFDTLPHSELLSR